MFALKEACQGRVLVNAQEAVSSCDTSLDTFGFGGGKKTPVVYRKDDARPLLTVLKDFF